jgi:hypothetical protein
MNEKRREQRDYLQQRIIMQAEERIAAEAERKELEVEMLKWLDRDEALPFMDFLK